MLNVFAAETTLLLLQYSVQSVHPLAGIKQARQVVGYIQVNQSHYRPEVPRGFQEVKVPRLHDNGPGGKFVSLTHRPPLPPVNAAGIHFC